MLISVTGSELCIRPRATVALAPSTASSVPRAPDRSTTSLPTAAASADEDSPPLVSSSSLSDEDAPAVTACCRSVAIARASGVRLPDSSAARSCSTRNNIDAAASRASAVAFWRASAAPRSVARRSSTACASESAARSCSPSATWRASRAARSASAAAASAASSVAP